MTNARSKIGRELGPLAGLLLGVTAPVLPPMALLLNSPQADDTSVGERIIGVVALVLVMLVFFVHQSINWTRKRRARYTSPLHRLQDWDDTSLPAEPTADDYDRWRGTLADRISIWFDPPWSEGTRRLLGWLAFAVYVSWAGLVFGLWIPDLPPAAISPDRPSLYGYWLNAFAVLSGLVVLTNFWLWASRTRREIRSRGSARLF